MPRAASSGRCALVRVALVLALAPLPAAAGSFEPEAILRQAREQVDRSLPGEAATTLLALRKGLLADHALLLRAQLLRQSGDVAGALEAAAEALDHAPPSEVRARIQLEAARARWSQGDLLGAYRAYRDAAKSARDPELASESLAELAHGFDSAGLPGDALLLYRELWKEWPLTEAGAAGWDRGRAIATATQAPPLPAADYLARAERLRGAYRCESALPTFDYALERADLDAEGRNRGLLGRAHCLFQRRRYAEAADAFRALAKAQPDDVDLEIMVARSLARAGEREKAVRALDAISNGTRGAKREYARYLTAVVLRTENPGRYRQLMESLERQRSSGTLAQRARWRLAWLAIENERYGEAAKLLRRLSRGSIWDIEIQRALFWLGIAEANADRSERGRSAGRAHLERLLAKVPLSYYGLLSARELEVQPQAERNFVGERNGAAGPEGEGADPSLQRAGWLARGGFPERAMDEIESRLRKGGLDREERLHIARLLHAIGEHYRAVRVVVDGFGSVLEQGIDPEWRDAWQLAWPRPFQKSVASATGEFGFDQALVYAVMREESTYRPRVESPVGARGLMQIIPPTGTRIARALGAERFDPDHLYEPDLNVRFGTWYLRDLLQRFEGSRALAIAAYNAGPEAVERWLPKRGHPDVDRFVEAVPYSETRRYLRKVLTSEEIYRMLYADEVLAAQPAVPEDR